MNVGEGENVVQSVGAYECGIQDQQIHAALTQLNREILGLTDLVSEVAAAIEQAPKQFADGKVALQNQNGSRAAKTQRLGYDGRRLHQAREWTLRVDGLNEIRLNRIYIQKLARHDEYRGAGSLLKFLGGRTPDAKKAHTAVAAAVGREEKTREREIEETAAEGAADIRRTANGAGHAGSGRSADSSNQRAEGPLPRNDIWNSRHDGRHSGEGPSI